MLRWRETPVFSWLMFKNCWLNVNRLKQWHDALCTFTVFSANRMQCWQPQSVVDLHIASRRYMLMTRNAIVSTREHKEMLHNTVTATIHCESKELEVIQSWGCWQMASGNLLNAESWAMKMSKQSNKNLPAFGGLNFYVCISWGRVTIAHMSYSISRCIGWLSKYIFTESSTFKSGVRSDSFWWKCRAKHRFLFSQLWQKSHWESSITSRITS